MPVGVVDDELLAVVGVADHQSVVGDLRARHRAGEHPAAQVGQFDPAAVRQQDVHGAGQRAQGAHVDPLRSRVGPEQAVRVVVCSGDEGVDLGEECVGHGHP